MRRIDDVLEALGQSRFRSRFRLGVREAAYLRDRGSAVIRVHAERFVRERLAAAEPANDGRQTPMRGHPVFVAQHATGTCCRGCLQKWHGIRRGRVLSEVEIDYVVDVICAWLERQRGGSAGDGELTLFDGLGRGASAEVSDSRCTGGDD